jgi:hypothetical protein
VRFLNWVRSYLKWVGFLIVVLPAITSKVAKGQQRPPAQHEAHPVGWAGFPVMEISIPVTEYSAPFIYSLWWSEIAACQGAPMPDGQMQKSVQWFVVASNHFTLDDNQGGILAGTYPDAATIYMGQPYVFDEGTVKHEMLHMMLFWAGYRFKNFHPKELFERPDCGISIVGKIKY